MHIRIVTISAGAIMLAAISPAMSHHPSGTGTSSTGGPIVTTPGTTLQKGASALYLVFEHISFDELSDTVLEAAAARHEHAHSLATLESPMLGYSYGLADRLMVSALLPYVVQPTSARRVITTMRQPKSTLLQRVARRKSMKVARPITRRLWRRTRPLTVATPRASAT
jgi:hypothetical protein